VVCNCHFGETVAAEAVATRVRRLSERTSSFATFAYGYAIAAALLAGTALVSRNCLGLKGDLNRYAPSKLHDRVRVPARARQQSCVCFLRLPNTVAVES
jgi:hypothetical protein